MGMYTELIFGARLKSETPAEVIDTLKYMLADRQSIETLDKLPDHSLFSTDRWQFMLRCSSYAFGASISQSKFHLDGNGWILLVRCNLKNYDQEIEKFLDWIKPWIECGSGQKNMYAIVCSEEGDPTLYYLEDSEENHPFD